MNFREILTLVNDIENTERNITYEDKLITIRYSLILDNIYVHIYIDDEDIRLILKLNNQSELVLDLTEDKVLTSKIPRKIYKKVIDTIFSEDV